MSVAHLKLLTSLALGGTAGVAALATMTSTPAAALRPAGDAAPTAPQPVTTTQSAPCPAGTVDSRDACVKIVRVPAPAPAAPVVAAVSAPTVSAPASEPQAPAEATHPESAAPEHHESPEPQHDGGQETESDG